MTRDEALAHIHAAAVATPRRLSFLGGVVAKLNENFLWISDAVHVAAYPTSIESRGEHLWRVRGTSRVRALRRTRQIALDINTHLDADVVAVYLDEEAT